MSKELHNFNVPLAAPLSEFSPRFVAGMANRMAVSYHKYGAVADAYPNKVDALESCLARIQKYRETGNTEYLIDAANFAMIEFMHPRHPDAYFKATDSDGSIGRVTVEGQTTVSANTDIVVTKSGKLLTDEDFERLADEAEAGYPVEKLR